MKCQKSSIMASRFLLQAKPFFLGDTIICTRKSRIIFFASFCGNGFECLDLGCVSPLFICFPPWFILKRKIENVRTGFIPSIHLS